MKDFKDYSVANITNEDIEALSKLEKVIGDKTNSDIVLIAYQSNSKGVSNLS